MTASEPHLFYTQCGSDEKPVPGAQAVPLSLIVTVTTPAWRHNFDGHGGSLCFDVIGQGFNWTCWSTSDEATKSMHRDLMERWSALHRPEAAPPNTIERDQLKAELAAMKVSLAAAEEALTCLGYQRAAHGPGWSPPQLSAGATMIVNATVYAYQAKAQKLEEECQTFRQERDQLKAAYEDLGRYIRDIFEQETDEKEGEHRNDIKSMIRYLLVDKAGEQRTRARQVAQERDQLKVSLKSQQDQIEQQASSLRERWAQIEKLAAERDKLKVSLEESLRNMNIMVAERDKNFADLVQQRDKALEQVRQMEIERDHVAGVDGSDAKAEIAKLKAERNQCVENWVSANSAVLALEVERNQLQADMSECIQQAHDVLSSIAARTVQPLDFVKAEVWCSKWVSKMPIKVNTKKFKESCEAFIAACDQALNTSRESKSDRLTREIRYLRAYGNKDCTAMAEDAMAKGVLEATNGEPNTVSVAAGQTVRNTTGEPVTVVGKPDHPQQTSTGEYITDGGEKYTATGEVLSKNPPGVDAPRTPPGQKIAELSARIPADQKGLSLDQINAEVGRSDADPYKAAVDRGRNYAAGKIVSDILGCEPAQFTDRNNPDHLRVLVDLLPIMRMDRSQGGWSEIAAGFDRTAAEKEAEKRAAIQAAQKPSKPAPKEYTLVHELPLGTTAKTAREMGLSVRPDIPDHATYRTGGEWVAV